MSGTYAPTTHTSPVTATVAEGGGLKDIEGRAPGQVFTVLNDQWAPTTVWLPTTISSDGFPTTMLPFTTVAGLGTASVTVT